jgi:hypothetical protein
LVLGLGSLVFKIREEEDDDDDDNDDESILKAIGSGVRVSCFVFKIRKEEEDDDDDESNLRAIDENHDVS